MAVRFNDQLLLWGIGVLQPASAGEALRFIAKVFPESGELPSSADVQGAIDRWVNGGQLSTVYGKFKLYSLTAKGNHLMPVSLRRLRDRARLFLLKDAHAAKVSAPGDAQKRMAGVSPAMTSSSSLQGARPISQAAFPGKARERARAYWPQIVMQLEVGSELRSPGPFFDLFSFSSFEGLYAASDRPARNGDLSLTDLGLAIGISPRLLTSFIHKPAKHYRDFTIGKRGGGERTIHSPRLFLKTVQYWILDYLLYHLPEHPSCHAYRRGFSIVTNAEVHVGKKFVANVDVREFFPSIRPEAVANLLRGCGFQPQLAAGIARLTSLNGSLPQGAPTSPALSNAYLFDVDEMMSQYCAARNLSYTRYADDITFSGHDRALIVDAIGQLHEQLGMKGLELKDEKTRIASSHGQQRVTGVVVNQKAQPPRKYRRQIRAMVHQAQLNPSITSDHIKMIKGHLSYLNAFSSIRNSPELQRYRTVVENISR